MKTETKYLSIDPRSEWLEANGTGGFAMGTVSGVRSRRYHALLVHALTPPTGRIALVNGFDAWVETPGGDVPIASQRYAPDVIHSDGARRLVRFDLEPWPKWTYRLANGAFLEQEIFLRAGASVTVLCWRLTESRAGVTLAMRPFLSGRDYHALHHENPAFRFEPEIAQGTEDRVAWCPYPGLPGVACLSNGAYTHAPEWYRNFLYDEERRRGLDFTEDLASPGIFRFDLSRGEAVWIVGVEECMAKQLPPGAPAEAACGTLRLAERERRSAFATPVDRAADAYIVRRGEGKSIVAGYPWFTDWGRDTFIALRGLCLATGRLAEAREILLEWAGALSEGMLPNRFADRGESPEFNAVDASLWYAIAVHDYARALGESGRGLPPRDRQAFRSVIEVILESYARGTRYGIRADSDGLLRAGEPGVPLTWMDARVGDRAVTPRIGKPVEVQALWLNALRIASGFSPRWGDLFEKGRESFRSKFWREAPGCLIDVVDRDHAPGVNDDAFRPNQIFAVGGLPLMLLDLEQARHVVDAVEAKLWTPLGLRSLAPDEPGYVGRYEGGVRERDGAYHQGTAWVWLLGPFVEAWVRVRGGSAEARMQAREKFLAPLTRHIEGPGLGHLPEVADGDLPQATGGCPCQAWSLGEYLRLDRIVLAEQPSGAPADPIVML